MKAAFAVALILTISLGLGFTVFGLTNAIYAMTESQGPYSYDVVFYDGAQTKNLGVMVHLNLSNFAEVWFVGKPENVVLTVSAEKVSDLVANFSWRVFWINLWVFKGKDFHQVGFGSAFLDSEDSSDSYLHRHMNMSVETVNMNYLESAASVWFTVEIMMDVFYDDIEYGLTVHTPMKEIGPIAIISPLFSSISLTLISTSTSTLVATAAFKLSRKGSKTVK